MAAGINFNNVGARGLPIDVIRSARRRASPGTSTSGARTHPASSTPSAGGTDEVAVGDEVVIHHGWWDADDPWVAAGRT